MPQDIEKYKVVRRGPKWCVRVIGKIDTADSYQWCLDRNMPYHIKKRPIERNMWKDVYFWVYESEWDYDFIFDDKKQALTFILGYL
jgi:hypothetical protein